MRSFSILACVVEILVDKVASVFSKDAVDEGSPCSRGQLVSEKNIHKAPGGHKDLPSTATGTPWLPVAVR